MMKIAETVITKSRWLPTPAEFLDYCADYRPDDDEGDTNWVDASKLLATIKSVTDAPSSLRDAIAKGLWDRGTARGRLITQGVKNPTTAQLDAELQTETFPHRGPVGAGLGARLTLGHVMEEDCR
jgi:hypothetical protein